MPMFSKGLWSPFSLILSQSDTQCSPRPVHASGVSVVAMSYNSSWQKKGLLRVGPSGQRGDLASTKDVSG